MSASSPSRGSCAASREARNERHVRPRTPPKSPPPPISRSTATRSTPRSSEFAQENGDYYVHAFHKIFEKTTGFLPTTFNTMAALLAGPLWAAAAASGAMFWAFLILEIIAWVQIGRGLWGNPGASFFEQAEKQSARAAEFLERAEAARAAGEDPSRFERLASNIGARRRAQPRAGPGRRLRRGHRHPAHRPGPAPGVQAPPGPLGQHRLREAVFALAHRSRPPWRAAIPSERILIGVPCSMLAIAPLTIYKFTVASPLETLNAFPEKRDLVGLPQRRRERDALLGPSPLARGRGSMPPPSPARAPSTASRRRALGAGRADHRAQRHALAGGDGRYLRRRLPRRRPPGRDLHRRLRSPTSRCWGTGRSRWRRWRWSAPRCSSAW